MDPDQEKGCEDVDWTHLAPDSNWWWVLFMQ
jgi:hypothetical protein